MTSFLEIWQSLPWHIDPVLIRIGAVRVYYYSLMYLVAFCITYLLVTYRIRKEAFPYSVDTIQNYFVWAVLGLLIGGRIGYVLFYNIEFYLAQPWTILFPFEYRDGFRFVGIRGMSYHGGLIGIVIASIIFCRRHDIDFWDFADLLCPAIPLGYTFGRVGNFINGELYGRATDAPWGMYFPLDTLHRLRHPSQLYEAFFEGIVLFAVLWILRRWRPFRGFHMGLYLIGYGTVRYFIEFTREPDPHLGFVVSFLTMGQILCLAMITFGIALIACRRWVSRR